jgi:Protein of unknwon function (DUF3310).
MIEVITGSLENTWDPFQGDYLFRGTEEEARNWLSNLDPRGEPFPGWMLRSPSNRRCISADSFMMDNSPRWFSEEELVQKFRKFSIQRKNAFNHTQPEFTGNLVDIFYRLIVLTPEELYLRVVTAEHRKDVISAQYFIDQYQRGKRNNNIFNSHQEETNSTMDNVNHPAHYNAYKGIEIIDLAEQMNFNRGNAVKYISRAGIKSETTEIEDLKKAAWFINREIQRLQSGTEVSEGSYKEPSYHPCNDKYDYKADHTCECKLLVLGDVEHSQTHICFRCNHRWGMGRISSERKEKVEDFLIISTSEPTVFNPEVYRIIDHEGNTFHLFAKPFCVFDLTKLESREDAEKMIEHLRNTITETQGISFED